MALWKSPFCFSKSKSGCIKESMYSKSPEKMTLNVGCASVSTEFLLALIFHQHKMKVALLSHNVYENERVNSSFVYEKLCHSCRVMCTKIPGVYVDFCKCTTPAKQISMSVPLNVKIFSCDCMAEHERVPAALHCDGMRKKSSGMYTAWAFELRFL